MADSMMDLLDPRLPEGKKYINAEFGDYKWIKVYDMRDDMNGNWFVPMQNPNINTMELYGDKVNMKADKKSERQFERGLAIKVLSRNVR